MSGAATQPSVAVVHDYFTQRGGAERLAEHIAAVFPDAPVFTSVLDPAAAPLTIDPHRITTSRLQRLFAAGAPLKSLSPLMAGAFRALDIAGHDVVVSSSAAFGHQVRVQPDAVHLCYCHTPPAFLYRREYYFAANPLARIAMSPAVGFMRRSDRAAARHVDRYIANSKFTAARIRASYGIEASVLYPSIDTASFTPCTDDSGRFLVVSRLRRHKAIDLAITAANLHGLPLDVIGDGSDRPRLERLAGPTVRFLGWRDDAEVASAMARCIALVVPGIEDFGMVSAEVQAAGRPPIGAAIGGTAEIVNDGVTGYLVAERTPAAFGAAMLRARGERLDSAALVGSAKRFDAAVFTSTLQRFITEVREARANGAELRPLTGSTPR